MNSEVVCTTLLLVPQPKPSLVWIENTIEWPQPSLWQELRQLQFASGCRLALEPCTGVLRWSPLSAYPASILYHLVTVADDAGEVIASLGGIHRRRADVDCAALKRRLHSGDPPSWHRIRCCRVCLHHLAGDQWTENCKPSCGRVQYPW